MRTERVDVGGLALAVRVWPATADTATRPPLVLLPGTGTTAHDWDVVAPVLAGHREVRAVDLRGHGDSDRSASYSIALMADDVVTLLDSVGEPVDLVGHSLGGLVALRVAAARPAGVRRLVLEDVGLLRPRPPAPPARPEGELAFDWRVVEQVRPEIDTPDPGWPDLARALRVPVLVLGGGPSSHVPQEAVASLVAAVPDARLVTLDTGHLVHATDPEAFVAAVEAFLEAAHSA